MTMLDIHSMKILDLPKHTLTMIMAGGRGERLRPLTDERSKPGVPFAANYRIIDFTLSNVWNSGLRKAYVLTQYKSYSLDKHLLKAGRSSTMKRASSSTAFRPSCAWGRPGTRAPPTPSTRTSTSSSATSPSWCSSCRATTSTAWTIRRCW